MPMTIVIYFNSRIRKRFKRKDVASNQHKFRPLKLLTNFSRRFYRITRASDKYTRPAHVT